MVYEKVKEIIVSQLDIPESELSMETNLIDDLKADSLDLVDMIISFEDEFDVEFPEDEADNFKTVGDIVNYLEANK